MHSMPVLETKYLVVLVLEQIFVVVQSCFTWGRFVDLGKYSDLAQFQLWLRISPWKDMGW